VSGKDFADPVTAMLVADRASAALGIEVVEHAPGYALARMTVRDDMVNGHDLAHGGLVFALADTAFACACNGWGPVTVAAGADITFVRPAHRGDLLEAEEVVAEFRGRSSELRS
jgi:acyl-CoA thioesterase